ncbi:HypC/HybG/HupF family hydrogenase formation chaperone [Allosalinactinospora lopnorensis]|uniref:HypC/HybG/HupF family hydrogenase formation chaperone n=1 Tax=Allosalinactinospora lopnorensis TaxID=1352348 RepID=UPI000623E446|nr:HypC/HybG/HupF family hydrogenase formation chaperone [Allosalinactinospora lopnorensis]
MRPDQSGPKAAEPPQTAPDCHEDVCLTCSDQAIPVRIQRLLGDGLALADTGAGTEEISVALVDAGAGDLVLVHAKEAISRVQEVPGDERR